MELVFEVLNARQFVAGQSCQKTFGPAGGVIGRGEGCDWIIADRLRLLSKRHAQISFRERAFFLTDISGNGVIDSESGTRLPKGERVRIKDGGVYVMGDFEIRARLIASPASSSAEAGHVVPAGSLIPDDMFLDLDPLKTLDQREQVFSEIDNLINPVAVSSDSPGRSDYARIDMESLLLPELVEASTKPEPVTAPPSDAAGPSHDGFWERFGIALGMDLSGLGDEAREALAINAALLLRQSVQGLQESLRTRSELKNELRLTHTLAQAEQKNPLKVADDGHHALQMLLWSDKPGQLSAEQAIARAFRDLQAHQVALLSASRATLRATLEHFSPRQLILRLQLGDKPLVNTSGRYWRAYGRYHQSLCQDDDWTERLLARDFAQAYDEQVRLISTLHNDHHG
ncbi:type VI secretion system-associated FHA domain protein TagH [Pseudomonas hefeiensis]|uniref:Type VI secretion system-associated FHA domain protein TagH n=1 Tax=Pseudomonas hefeiensis TaxID=2738125 RepID=A0ABY9GBL5_9PSED|nr:MULTISPECIES: type VI secretion system-associated FHA domain protein TagH [unclassified Pseudomonas]WLH12952.1 type VI secretion system-associated FHA domain protein TagH [Pseudomonas sp. FP205]WLH96018.1 type VI secretion system-associated FHA domain protein TagH [Pseudomonas sp. FP53]WLI40289.1 type VI secretion system-associated FHA domain protein TagH [Pseudomonas sp. FP821]